MAKAQTASLGTAQTIVRLKAGATAPQLRSLQAPGNTLWSNKAVEDLIPTVKVDGHSVPLHWKLVRGAEQRDAKHVSFVYETQSPHLRLIWAWSAPAATGPLEHRIEIENLDARALWLPLQTSFRYDWTVPVAQRLKQIYVDKGAGKPSPIGTHNWTFLPATAGKGNPAPMPRMKSRARSFHGSWWSEMESRGTGGTSA
jgi:hypothetical protein